MKDQHPIYCPVDARRLSNVPEPLLWTGAVQRIPEDPDDLLCLTYLPCETCRRAKRPHWHRYEVEPPNPRIKIVVPVITREEAA